MKPVQWIKIFSAAVLVSCSNPARTSMHYPASELHVTALQASPADQVNSLRLVSDGNTLSLAGMAASQDGMHAVSIRALEADPPGAPQPLGRLASPFGTPFWDVATTPKGFATVWTTPGSAISSLGFRAPGLAEIAFTGHYPSGVFQNPRFVRGNPGLAVTACAMQPVGEALVLFQDGLESGHAEYRILPAAGEGTVLDGLLIRMAGKGSGYLLLAKYAAPALGVSQRTDLRGESAPGGVLRCVRLAADLRVIDSAFSPLGDTAVFEFDADVSGEQIYLLATSQQGYLVAAAEIHEEAWHWTRAAEAIRVGETLFAPAVSAQGKSAAMVFLTASESGSRNILRGRISIQAR
jgi:hypothetical protein